MFFRRKKEITQGDSSKKNVSSFKGYCVCPKCNYSLIHQRGTPCSTLKCPVCSISLVRQDTLGEHAVQRDTQNENRQEFPFVNIELCTGCEICVNTCSFEAIIMENDKAKIINNKCMNCRACISICPSEAIS